MLICFVICRWYHDNLKRDKAEDMLKRVRKNGAFLVRKKESDQLSEHGDTDNQPESQNEELSFAISFRSVVIILFFNVVSPTLIFKMC